MKRSRPSRASLLPLLAALPISLLGCFGSPGWGAIKRLMYEHPGRDRWQQPEQVVAALALEAGDVVADLGAGGGYFTYPIAEAVGESGRVYAIDVDDALLAYVAKQSEKRGLPQIVTVRASETDPGLAADSVDLIFLANVFHHLPKPDVYFAGARQVLRRGGRVAIIEVAEDGFPRGHATSPEEIAEQMAAAGYALVEQHPFLDRQSFQVFAPRAD
jgi:arsenite methyltransferase